ncbi:MAG TPA: hypothetical protein VIQ80_01350 [Candidatus Saccharimonadales bacterium]
MKKLIPVAVVALLLFFLFSKPKQAADAVNGGAGAAKNGAEGIVTFIGALSGGTLSVLIVLGIAWLIVNSKK